jgi:RAB6A-GEF complex partner protein 1
MNDTDALLPSVVKLVERFPSFLDVIAHCARKTEVATWEYFFSIVGDPKLLFQRCIEEGRLQTATSYLIIIQNLEPISISAKVSFVLF